MSDGPETPPARSDEPPIPAPMSPWLKTLLLALLVLIVVAVLVMAISGGEHGPGRHQSLGSEPVQPSSGSPVPLSRR